MTSSSKADAAITELRPLEICKIHPLSLLHPPSSTPHCSNLLTLLLHPSDHIAYHLQLELVLKAGWFPVVIVSYADI